MTNSIADHVHQDAPAKILTAIELSKMSWVVALHLPSQDKISVFELPGGDVDRLLAILERARQALISRGTPVVEIHTCYEAGYDGFWLHRLLVGKGICNQVLDSASIQVSRRRRNVKTDRTDAESLVRVFMAWHRGETKACSIVRVPSPEQEDLKRLHRSRENLLHEQVRHSNRIKGLLCLQGVRHIAPDRKGWTSALKGLQTRDGRPFPPRLMAELRREAKLLAMVTMLLREVGAELKALIRTKASAPQRRNRLGTATHPIAVQLARLRGIGPHVRSASGYGGLLSQLCQSTRGRELRGPHTHAIQQRHKQPRAGHQQSWECVGPPLHRGTCVAVASQSADERTDAVVHGASWQREGTCQANCHRGDGAQAHRCALAVSRDRARPRRCDCEAVEDAPSTGWM